MRVISKVIHCFNWPSEKGCKSDIEKSKTVCVYEDFVVGAQWPSPPADYWHVLKAKKS